MLQGFEHPFCGKLSADLSAEVRDPHGHAPATIIQTDHDWEIEVRWHIEGVAAPFLGGVWHIASFIESIGPGEEKQVGNTETVPLITAPPLPARRTYSASINVPAGELSEGSYKLVTLVTYQHDGYPLEMAGFVEGPIIQVYEGLPA